MRCQSGLWSSGLLGIYVGVRQSIETMEFIFGGGLTLKSHKPRCLNDLSLIQRRLPRLIFLASSFQLLRFFPLARR